MLYAVVEVSRLGEINLRQCASRDAERCRLSNDGTLALIEWDPAVAEKPTGLWPVAVYTYDQIRELMESAPWAEEMMTDE